MTEHNPSEGARERAMERLKRFCSGRYDLAHVHAGHDLTYGDLRELLAMKGGDNELAKRLREFEGSDALGNGDFALLEEAASRLEAPVVSEAMIEAGGNAVEWSYKKGYIQDCDLIAIYLAMHSAKEG